MASIHAEVAAGEIDSPAERLTERLEDVTLPEPWRHWLWLQMGVQTD